MDSKDMEGSEIRARSFRNEDYNTRRVFLRSYPLHWGEDDEENKEESENKEEKENKEENVEVTDKGYKRKPLKKMIISLLHWGEGRVFVFKRFKNKVVFYVISCLPPVGFKPPTAMISA